jgi:hypothetical protein
MGGTLGATPRRMRQLLTVLLFSIACGGAPISAISAAPDAPQVADDSSIVSSDSKADSTSGPTCSACTPLPWVLNATINCTTPDKVASLCGGGNACAVISTGQMTITEDECTEAKLTDGQVIPSATLIAQLLAIDPPNATAAIQICTVLHETTHVSLGVCDRSQSEVAAYGAELNCLEQIQAAKCDPTTPLWEAEQCGALNGQHLYDSGAEAFNACIAADTGAAACEQACIGPDLYGPGPCISWLAIYAQNSCHPKK